MSFAARTAQVAGLRLEGVGVEVEGRRLLDAVDLEIEPGEPVVLTGSSGSGKTLLCLTIAGVTAPSAGSVLLGDRPLRTARAPVVGLVLQDHGLVAGLTALENVVLPLQERRMSPSQITPVGRSALVEVGLIDQCDRLVDELSGGERQRVGIARAIAGVLPILIADEPTSELDPENRERVLGLFTGERARGRIVVVASDDPEVIEHFHRVLLIRDGTVVEHRSR